MKIKHWQGYGTVSARKVPDKTCTLHVQVVGNHEWGIDRRDPYTLHNWLVKRFDRTVPDYPDWHRSRPIIEVRPGWMTDPVLGSVDTCDYYFTY